MKLAVMKQEGSIPGGGFHYMLMPRLDRENEEKAAELWGMMGHVIIDVPAEVGERLLSEAGAALRHQCEVAVLTEKSLAKSFGGSS